VTIYMMSVREINRLILAGKPVEAVYLVDGVEVQGRILLARRRAGKVEVQRLDDARWYPLKDGTAVWPA
jgi:hypothetical protein